MKLSLLCLHALYNLKSGRMYFLDMCIYASCYEKNFRLLCLRQRYVCTHCMQY